MTIKDLILIFLLVVILLMAGSRRSKEDNHYILYTRKGPIHSSYHNSRDLNNGYMEYYSLNGGKRYIQYSQVDSVLILKENWLFCGPKDEKLKYVEKQ